MVLGAIGLWMRTWRWYTGMPMPPLEEISNIEAIGRVLYTDYVYFFQAAGLILLVAMVGAIVLTLRHREGVKRQDIAMFRTHARLRPPLRSSR
jgi:NADH:ubiquinone oxidoreductase subunit 6 (subunit J)